MSYLKKAFRAVNLITPNDINELKTAKNSADTTRMILDAVHVILIILLLPVKLSSRKISKLKVELIKNCC